MSKEKYNLLAIGSCRICSVLNKYQNTYNTWEKVGKRMLNPKYIIGRSWSINEQLELLKLIKGDKPFVEYVGCQYPKIESIKDSLFFLRKASLTICVENSFLTSPIFIVPPKSEIIEASTSFSKDKTKNSPEKNSISNTIPLALK